MDAVFHYMYTRHRGNMPASVGTKEIIIKKPMRYSLERLWLEPRQLNLLTFNSCERPDLTSMPQWILG